MLTSDKLQTVCDIEKERKPYFNMKKPLNKKYTGKIRIILDDGNLCKSIYTKDNISTINHSIIGMILEKYKHDDTFTEIVLKLLQRKIDVKTIVKYHDTFDHNKSLFNNVIYVLMDNCDRSSCNSLVHFMFMEKYKLLKYDVKFVEKLKELINNIQFPTKITLKILESTKGLACARGNDNIYNYILPFDIQSIEKDYDVSRDHLRYLHWYTKLSTFYKKWFISYLEFIGKINISKLMIRYGEPRILTNINIFKLCKKYDLQIIDYPNVLYKIGPIISRNCHQCIDNSFPSPTKSDLVIAIKCNYIELVEKYSEFGIDDIDEIILTLDYLRSMSNQMLVTLKICFDNIRISSNMLLYAMNKNKNQSVTIDQLELFGVQIGPYPCTQLVDIILNKHHYHNHTELFESLSNYNAFWSWLFSTFTKSSDRVSCNLDPDPSVFTAFKYINNDNIKIIINDWRNRGYTINTIEPLYRDYLDINACIKIESFFQ